MAIAGALAMRYTCIMAKQTKQATKKSTKVDFEPNKMTLAVATLAVVILLLLAVIVTYNS
jgi:hypothetical protein